MMQLYPRFFRLPSFPSYLPPRLRCLRSACARCHHASLGTHAHTRCVADAMRDHEPEWTSELSTPVIWDDAHPAPARGRPVVNTRSILPSTARLVHIFPHTVRIVPRSMRSVLVACARLAVPGPLRSGARRLTASKQMFQPSHQHQLGSLQFSQVCSEHEVMRCCATSTRTVTTAHDLHQSGRESFDGGFVGDDLGNSVSTIVQH